MFTLIDKCIPYYTGLGGCIGGLQGPVVVHPKVWVVQEYSKDFILGE